MVIAISQNDIH